MEANNKCVEDDGQQVDYSCKQVPRQHELRVGTDHKLCENVIKGQAFFLFLLFLYLFLFKSTIAHLEDYNDNFDAFPI